VYTRTTYMEFALPPGFGFSSDSNINFSAVSSPIYGIVTLQYDYVNREAAFLIYAHAALPTATVTVKMIATGRI